jgi:hypothetical protein
VRSPTFDYEVRVYALVPVATEVAANLRNLLGRSPSGQRWDEISKLVTEAGDTYSGPVVVIATESLGSDVLGQTELPAEEVSELRLHEDRMESTFNEARLLSWLERLGVPLPLSWPEKDRLGIE